MADQFYQYGKIYFNEANSIIDRLPKLPNKWENGNKLSGHRVSEATL
jgi:hypothetical protein|tara:strand:- start:470 stop:610 length:141 start_codon:yes stop_codon:yes gene_type:complete